MHAWSVIVVKPLYFSLPASYLFWSLNTHYQKVPRHMIYALPLMGTFELPLILK